jgi:hypothetical protein
MTDPKRPRKQRKSREPHQIADLVLNKETVADLTEGEVEHVKGGRILRTNVSQAATCAEAGCE